MGSWKTLPVSGAIRKSPGIEIRTYFAAVWYIPRDTLIDAC